MDLFTKFNRGLIIAMVDENVYEAVQTYRGYISYLKENNYEQELITARNAFLNKLTSFASCKQNREKYAELIPAYQELMAAYPENSGIRIDCAECFIKLKQYDIALEILKDLRDNDLLSKKTIITAAKGAKNYELAIESAKYVCEKEPDNAHNFCVLGTCYDDLYRLNNDETTLKNAILNMKIACKMAPDEPMYLKNLIVLYTNAKQLDLCSETWNKYLTFSNIPDKEYYNYAAHLLRRGDFKRGFKYYEKRFSADVGIFYPEMAKPKYDGKKDLSNKTLLVQSEQGFGDTIMFARFLKQIKARKIILGVPACLISLFKRSFPDIEVVKRFCNVNYDYHISIMSLPYILGITSDAIPCTGKYLVADEKRVIEFKQKYFKGDEFKIGVIYQGNFKGKETRNMPFEYLLPLTEIPNAKVYSLQFGCPDSLYKGTKIINMGEKMSDFDDSAAMVENMDLIVSTDCVNLNLAGALGKRTFGLFNYLPEFRWFDLSGDDVKWYSSIKPYQCQRPNDWAPVIQKIANDIKKILKNR